MNKNILDEQFIYSFIKDKTLANKLLDHKFNLYSRTKLKMNIFLFSIVYLLLLVFTTLNFLLDDEDSFDFESNSNLFYFTLITFLVFTILLLILLLKNSLGTIAFNHMRYCLYLLTNLFFYIKTYEVMNIDNEYKATNNPQNANLFAKYKAKIYFSNSMFMASIEVVAYLTLLYKNNNILFLITICSRIPSFIVYSNHLDIDFVKIILGLIFKIAIYIIMYIVRRLIHNKSLYTFLSDENVKNLQSYYEKFIDNFHSPIITINENNLIIRTNKAFSNCFYKDFKQDHEYNDQMNIFQYYSELLSKFYEKEGKCSLIIILKRLTESNNGKESMCSSIDNLFINIGKFSFNQIKNLNTDTSLDNNDQNTNQTYEIFIRTYYLYGKKASTDIMFNNISNIINTASKKTENMLKDALFSKIAHEFKTPLITLSNQIELIEEEIKKNPDLHKLTLRIGNGNYTNEQSISVMLKNIKYLSYYTSYLISDIIQYSSNDTYIKSQKSTLDIKIVKNINYSIFDFSYSILLSLLKYSTGHKANILPNKLFDSDLNKFIIKTDVRKFNQLLINILTNAVKFTKKGFITVFAYLEKNKETFEKDIYYTSTKSVLSQENELIGYLNKSAIHNAYYENFMIIGIKDTGEGISNKYINNKSNDGLSLLFKDYNSTGSGFGLMICKQISELLDLEMKIHSYKGMGTIVTVKVPLFTEQNNIAFEKLNLNELKRSNSLEIEKKPLINNIKLALKLANRVSLRSTLGLCKKQNTITRRFSKSSPLKRRGSTLQVRDCGHSIESEEESSNNYESLVRNSILDEDITKVLSNMQFKEESSIKVEKKSRDSTVNNDSSNSSNNNEQSLLKVNDQVKVLLTPVDLIKNISKSSIPNTVKNINPQIINNFQILSNIKDDNREIIIICDDSKQILNSLENLLKSFTYIRNYYNIIKVTDGSYLLTQIYEHQFNKPDRVKLVISDENMEFLDGSEFIKIIRKLELNNKLKYFPKFVCLTAYEDLSTKERILSSGFDKILYKPANKSELKALLIEYDLIK